MQVTGATCVHVLAQVLFSTRRKLLVNCCCLGSWLWQNGRLEQTLGSLTLHGSHCKALPYVKGQLLLFFFLSHKVLVFMTTLRLHLSSEIRQYRLLLKGWIDSRRIDLIVMINELFRF